MTFIGFIRRGCHNRVLWISFIRTPDIFGTSHRHTMIISGSTFCTHNIVIATAFGQMRCFNTASVCTTAPHWPGVTNNLLFHRIIFYDADKSRFFIACTCFPFQWHNIFLSVIIMEHGCIKAWRMQVYRLTPRTSDILCCDHKVVYVKVSGIHGIHNAVYYIK